MIAFWLDEEWGPMDVHQQLGKAAGMVLALPDAFICAQRSCASAAEFLSAGKSDAGDAYVACRQKDAVQDYSDLCLGLAAGLESFSYRETFTNNFEIGMVPNPEMNLHNRLGQQQRKEFLLCSMLSWHDAMVLQCDPLRTETCAYDAGNKVVEILMLRGGAEVCSCGSDADEMLQRHNESLTPQ